MRKIIFALALLSLNAQAKNIHFDCKSPDQHTLQVNLDDSPLKGDSQSPLNADISFVFDSQKYDWKNTQYLSFLMNTGETASLFQEDSLDELYIQESPKTNEATANVSIDRDSYDLTCKKTY